MSETTFLITSDYYVNQASVPLGVAVFGCTCGATQIDYDLSESLPEGWSTAPDGSVRCPHCTSASEDPKPED